MDAFAVLTAATTAKKSSQSYLPMLVILALFGLVWYFFLRPRRKAMMEQQRQGSQFQVGDEVMTVGGLIGTVVATDGDRITLRTGGADGLTGGAEMTFIRQAIKGKPPAPKVVEPVGDAEAPGAADEEPGGAS